MSGPSAPEPDGDEPDRAPWVERAPLLVGVVGAVVAVVAIFAWSAEVLLVAQLALAWLSLGLAALGLIAVRRDGQNARAIAVLAVGIAGFGFWLAAPPAFGPLPVYAYLLTAAVLLALGLVAPKPDASRRRPVWIACAGAVVFTVAGAFSRLGG